MYAATQVINLAAGYLAPEFRRGRVRSIEDLVELLDRLFNLLRQASGSAVFAILDDLARQLQGLRRGLRPSAWRRMVAAVRDHPFRALLQQDPLIRRMVDREGCDGPDAVTLDLFYRDRDSWPLPSGTTPLGTMIYGYASHSSGAEAMRNRCQLIADEIDRVAARATHPEILALDCAHLREARLSVAFRNHSLARIVALSAEAAVIPTLARDLRRPELTILYSPNRAILKAARNALGRFDFIYAPTLFDRLDPKAAASLAAAAFARLKPGGKLWIASLDPAVSDAAWFEMMMDWWPIYRDREAFAKLLDELPLDLVASSRTFKGLDNAIGMLEIVRV